MRTLSPLIFLLLIGYSVTAQHTLPDSIARKFSVFPRDSNYVNSLNTKATEYLKTNPSVSRVICNHVIDVAQKIRYTKGYARALTVMGNAYWYEGVYEFAQNYYLLAARQYQSINDSIGLGQTYNNIGEVYKKLDENQKALQYLLRSAELKKRDTATHAITLYNIGELYIRLNNLESARKYIDDSYEIAVRTNNKKVIAFDYWSLAAMELKENDRKQAIAYYQDAEKIWKELKETRSLIQTYQDIAEVYLHDKNYAAAETYLDKAIALAREIKVPDLQVKNYLRYARLDSLRGDYKNALYFFSRHNSLKDSVYNLLKAEQIARLQTIYETETREAENQQLRSEKELRDSQLAFQRKTLVTISIGLLISGVLAWILYRQRKKILFQKNAIEIQATVLLKLNEELLEFNKNLEARIEARTSQLTIQNQRLTEYTFINAHKLRAPVASILGLINLLNQVDENEKDLVLQHLKVCSEQLDNIIHEVSRNLESAIVNETHP